MTVPSHLYKYRSLASGKTREYTKRILTNNEIYFPTYTEFNDPFDCNLHVALTADPEIQRYRLRQLNPDKSDAEIDSMVDTELSPSELKKREEDIRSGMHDVQKKVGIFAMSARRNHILMWSHYADSHRGICLEFATSDSKLFGCSLTQVVYQKEYPKFNIYDKIDQKWVSSYLATKAYQWLYKEE
jgi:hypothetical protein